MCVIDRERFIPQRVGQLTTELCSLTWPEDQDGTEQFRSFSRLTSALYHYEFHDREQVVTEAWERVGDDPGAASLVAAELTGLLDGANYTPVTMAELDDALANESLIPLRLEVDLDDYDELLIYRRGSELDTVEIPKWMGLRSKERTITVDKRVVVYTRVKAQSWFDERKIDPAERNLVPGHVSLRQFQNVPRADIEMLLPSTQVGLRLTDSLLIGVPAVASGVAVLATKLLPTLGLIFLLVGAWLGFRDEQPDIDQAALVILLGGALTLGGFVFRQWAKLKNRRLEYLKTLTENLYFRTLAAGTGVLHTLLSSAEQQEVVEVLLAYRFLLAAPGRTHRSRTRRRGRDVAARRRPRRHRLRGRRRHCQAAPTQSDRGPPHDAGAAPPRVPRTARPPLGRPVSVPAQRTGCPVDRPRRTHRYRRIPTPTPHPPASCHRPVPRPPR